MGKNDYKKNEMKADNVIYLDNKKYELLNSEDYKNNKESNLILLCPNCHSLTETYKGANLNNGRKMRTKYYLKGENQ